MALTDKQLLLLDNFMYFEGSINKDLNASTLGELANYYLQHQEEINYERLSGGFESEEGITKFKEILTDISNDDDLRRLGLGETTQEINLSDETKSMIGVNEAELNGKVDQYVRARCFTEYDAQGNEMGHVVAFRGTGGTMAPWKDNFEGLYMTETTAQAIAREYVEGLDYNDLTVTGHSKGGNLSMHVTIQCPDKVQSCVSYDGQGFGKNYLNNVPQQQLVQASEKITSVSAHNDFVNILLTSVAGKQLFVLNNATGANAHSPYDLYVSNKEILNSNNGMFTQENIQAQDKLMGKLHNITVKLDSKLSENKKELVSGVAGPIVAGVMSRDAVGTDIAVDVGGAIGTYNVKAGADTLKSAVTGMEEIGKGALSQGVAFTEMITNSAQNVVAGIEKVGESAVTLATNGVTKVADGTKSVIEGMEQFGKNVVTAENSVIQGVLDKVNAPTAAKDMLSDIADFKKIVITQAADGTLSFVDGVKGLAEKTGEAGKLAIVQAADGTYKFLDNAKEAAESIGESSKLMIGRGADGALQFLDTSKVSILGDMDVAKETLKDNLKNMSNALQR